MSYIGISDNIRSIVADKLQYLLANEFTLLVKSYKFHWNVRGPFFGPLHALFKDGYEMAAEASDEIAERIQQLGFEAEATLHEFSKKTILKENPGKNPSAENMLKELLKDHQSIITEIRELIDITESKHRDMGTSNFLAEIILKHEKYAWILRSHIEK